MDDIARDWDTISTAFDDLASLAEAVEDDRLDNYPNITDAFNRVHKVLELARDVVTESQAIEDGDSGYDLAQTVEELAELFGIES